MSFRITGKFQKRQELYRKINLLLKQRRNRRLAIYFCAFYILFFSFRALFHHWAYGLALPGYLFWLSTAIYGFDQRTSAVFRLKQIARKQDEIENAVDFVTAEKCCQEINQMIHDYNSIWI